MTPLKKLFMIKDSAVNRNLTVELITEIVP